MGNSNLCQTFQAKTINNEPIDNELILCFWKKFLHLSLPWHTDITQRQGKFRQIQHLRYNVYPPSWGIRWWSKNMIKYYVTKNRFISTLTGITYMGMHNYVDSKSQQYIFEEVPTRTTKEYRPAVLVGSRDTFWDVSYHFITWSKPKKYFTDVEITSFDTFHWNICFRRPVIGEILLLKLCPFLACGKIRDFLALLYHDIHNFYSIF